MAHDRFAERHSFNVPGFIQLLYDTTCLSTDFWVKPVWGLGWGRYHYLPNIYQVSNYLQLVLLTTPHPGDVRWQSAFLLSTMLVPPLGRVFNYYEICADCRVGTGHRALGGPVLATPPGPCINQRGAGAGHQWQLGHQQVGQSGTRTSSYCTTGVTVHSFTYLLCCTLHSRSCISSSQAPGELIYLSVGHKLSQFI